MITRRQFVLGAAALPLSGQLFAAQSFTAGKEYLVVAPSAPTSRDKIEVVLFSPTPAHTACSLNRISRSGPKQPLLMLPSASALLLGSPSSIPSRRPTSLSKPLVLSISFPCRFLKASSIKSIPTILKIPRLTSLISWPRPASTVKSGNKRCAPSA